MERHHKELKRLPLPGRVPSNISVESRVRDRVVANGTTISIKPEPSWKWYRISLQEVFSEGQFFQVRVLEAA